MICGGCGVEIPIGSWPFCPHPFVKKRDAAIHTSERVVVYENAAGEVRVPGHTGAMHEKYAAAGFERRELPNFSDIRRLEKDKGLVHESSNYDNSGHQEKDTGART